MAFTAVSLGGAACLRDISHRRSGVSDSAMFLAREARTLVEKNDRSFSLIGKRGEVLSELAELRDEHRQIGWDGAEAPPVSSIALNQAKELVLALPASIPNPELAVDPDDGAVSLEWYAGPSRIFSVSVGTTSRMPYAGIDGTYSWHGVAPLEGARVPDYILQGIKRIFA